MTILRSPTVVRHSFSCLLLALVGFAAGFATAAESAVEASAGVRIIELGANSEKAPPPSSSTQNQSKIQGVSSANPWLSFLPVEVEPDYEGWRPILEQKQKTRAIELQMHQLAQGVMQFQINQAELEPSDTKGLNDTIGTAEAVVGFGTGAGEDASADISGTLSDPAAPSVVGAAAEDNGAIGLATITGLVDDSAILSSSTIGDGSFGSSAASAPSSVDVDAENNDSIGSANAFAIVPYETVIEESTIGDGLHGSGGTGTGDWDFYSFVVNPGRQVVDLSVNDLSSGFRPILAIYDPSGNLLGVFDDFFSEGSIGLTAEFTATGGPVTFYLAVGGNKDFDGNPSDEVPTDPLTPGTGVGFGSEGDYELLVAFVPPGDFDVFAFDAIGGDFITVEADTDAYGTTFNVLDTIVALIDSSGAIVAFNDDGVGSGSNSFDSFLSFNVPADGTYYVFVGGFSFLPTTEASFPSDAFDSSTGPGFGSEGDYDLTISRNTLDIDVYSFDLDAGDIIGTNLTGAAQFPFLLDPLGNNLVGSASSISGIFPAASPLPGGGVASHAYVVGEAGTYYALVFGGAGAYTLELRGFRPPQEAANTTQRIFIDFDGATLDTTIYDPIDGIVGATLSPLSAFLSNWGLVPGDEDAVIDAILQEVERSLKTDMEANGLNPSFGVEILNSRDHADPFGGANVSRIIVGGTIAESGIPTIGIAQSIDPGNFELAETALVLLDLLSAPAADPNSLNQYPLGGGATRIDVVGAGVGNIVAHEAGHFLANFHTNNANALANIMDTGGNLANLVGVGPDGIFGTGDDVDVFFELDAYDPFEGLLGVEDTKNAIAWALFGGGGVLYDSDADGMSDILWRNFATGQNYMYLMDGQTIGSQGTVNSVPDANWQVVGRGDYDGDGMADVLWRNFATGQNYVYFLDGISIVGQGTINTVADQNWMIVSNGDFNGDGNSDMLWRNSATGQNYMYLMDGLTILDQGTMNTVADQNWQVAATGDFDGDGNTDMLWRNSATGQNYMYIMDGKVIIDQGTMNTVTDQNWQVAASGDFDGDGNTDMLWRNAATGQNYMYLMDGKVIIDQGTMNTVTDQNWQVAASGDFDGDGMADMMWRNAATGQNYMYRMNGKVIAGQGTVNTVTDQNWQVVGNE